MRSFLVSFSLLLVLLSVCMSCQQEQKPDWLLSDSQLEDALFDYHMAQSMTVVYQREDSAYRVAVQAALEKHQLTPATLDSNLRYYAHHVEQMYDIYKHLEVRLNAAAGLTASAGTGLQQFSESGDTMDIWLGGRFASLTPTELNAVKTFSIEADSTYRMRDRFQLEGQLHFLEQPNDPRPNNFLIGLIVTFANDSIQTSTRSINHDQPFLLNLACDTLQPIRNVSGYLMLGAKKTNPVLIEHLRLLRIHKEEEKKAEEQVFQADTLETSPLEQAPPEK